MAIGTHAAVLPPTPPSKETHRIWAIPTSGLGRGWGSGALDPPPSAAPAPYCARPRRLKRLVVAAVCKSSVDPPLPAETCTVISSTTNDNTTKMKVSCHRQIAVSICVRLLVECYAAYAPCMEYGLIFS